MINTVSMQWTAKVDLFLGDREKKKEELSMESLFYMLVVNFLLSAQF